MFRFALAAAGLTAYLSAVEASVSVTISNSCSESVALYDNSATETLAAGGSTTRTLANGYVGMYRNGVSDQATLAEISVDSDGTPWFDISIIPPDSGSCTSLSACQSQTGNTGFNTAVQMTPQSNIGEDTCETLTCEADGCADAYQYPSDDTKTHTCPEGTGFEITFCPGGSGGSSTSTTSASTSSSTPEPTTATPTPTTATPTPSTATPSPSPSEASASSASHSLEVESEAYMGNFTLSSASASAASAGTQGSNSQGNAGVEAAGDATTAPVSTSSDATTETTGTTTTSSSSGDVVEVSTQSSGSGSSSFTIIFAVGVCVLGMASAGFIYAVRQKKKKLDMESKSPMENVDRSCRDISVLVSTPESLSARL